jgi:nucleoside-diphosphate-sugar epimerase
MTQTILGAGGAIGIPLAKDLKNYTDKIRLAGRNPEKVNDTDELYSIDAKDFRQIDGAVKGSDVLYVTIGFEYSHKVWQQVWPGFMEAVIMACKKHGTKLVFFDNMYLYSRDSVPFMTEEAEINPPGKKGRVRARLHEMIMNEVNKGELTALIARAADFYGPYNKNSAIQIMAADNLRKGKKAQAFGNPDKVHTYTYTPDAAKAVAILGNTEDAFNQVWHLPTTNERLSNRDWINLIAKELGKEPKIQVVPVWMVKLIGLFVPIMSEFPEMIYQYEQDYVFDSTKFETRFTFKPTAPHEGVKEMVKNL